MQLGLNLPYDGITAESVVRTVQLAERLGYSSVWTAEAYGSDAIVPLTWAAAHTTRMHVGTAVMQMPARTPSMTGMTIATLDQLSGGRAICGLGVSGPQVVEGWHGQGYGRPLGRSREYITILRSLWAREAPLEFVGEHYQIPFGGPSATGLGKPLRLILRPRPTIPIYLAGIGPKNIALALELADGLLPIFFSPAHWKLAFGALADRSPAFQVAPSVGVAVGEDLIACRDAIRPYLALYIGGMGASGRNFYNDLACRYGYEGPASTIQALYLEGRKDEAIRAVPDALVDDLALVGPKAHLAEQLDRWREAPVDTLILNTIDRVALETIASLVL